MPKSEASPERSPGRDEPDKANDPGVASQWAALLLTERSGAVRFSVHARPRSSRAAILGVREGALDVALTSPPADGAANTELIQVLSRALDVRRSDVSIVVGASSRAKLVEVNGVRPADARTRLSGARLSGARR